MRALLFIRNSLKLNYHKDKAIYDSLMTCFSSHLNEAS